jgi:hypothetical protein
MTWRLCSRSDRMRIFAAAHHGARDGSGHQSFEIREDTMILAR